MFRPTCSIEMLKRRHEIVRAIRQFFDEREFVEVTTPLLSHDTVIDRHIDPVELPAARAVDRVEFGERLFLQTSPEFGMKRLLAAGASKIYQLAHAFRRNELGQFHNIEFQMLEWYETDIDYVAGRKFLGELFGELFGDRSVVERSYRDVFRESIGLDPLSSSIEQLQLAAKNKKSDDWVRQSNDRDEVLNWLLSQVIQPDLGKGKQIEIVFDWPASQSALAKTRIDTDGIVVSERFEAFVDGEELANGYHELLDAEELAGRNRENNALRIADGKVGLPETSRLLDAMRFGLPSCCGVAVGVDRLVMKLTGMSSLSDVMPFPFERA
ncbi:MAG: EF-P lysine aminoacylase EpmA [Pirellulaceae bacterium]